MSDEVCHQCGEALPDEPWKWEGMWFCCKRCREDYETEEEIMTCPKCGGRNIEIDEPRSDSLHCIDCDMIYEG